MPTNKPLGPLKASYEGHNYLIEAAEVAVEDIFNRSLGDIENGEAQEQDMRAFAHQGNEASQGRRCVCSG